MLIVGLQVTCDIGTGAALMSSITCREIITVSTQATNLPPKKNQGRPEKTAEIENAGRKQCISAKPMIGGAAPPHKW
jgi:hypothetical protein